MLPVPANTFLSNTNTMSVVTEMPVAPSTGVEATSSGAVSASVVKLNVVELSIPAYGLPLMSLNIPAVALR